MARYPQDPRWLTARFDSTCARCQAPIRKGERIFYYPNTKSAYGQHCKCADEMAADFNNAAFDEMMWNS